MYIKSLYKSENNYRNEKEYKTLIKDTINFDLRRVSKLNLLAIYGAVNCMKDMTFDKNLSIYTATNNGNVEEIYKVLNELKESSPIMPFDFLNINTNNTGFYISKAINSIGNNYTISSSLSFEKAFQMAFTDSKNSFSSSFLLGYIDESVDNIPKETIKNISKNSILTKDSSSWFYMDNNEESSIIKIELVEYFKNITTLNDYLDKLDYELVSTNQVAKTYLDELNIDKSKLFNNDNLYSSSNIIDLIGQNKKSSIYISLDDKKRAYLFYFIK